MDIDSLTIKEVKHFKKMGYRVIRPRKRNANGPDLTIIRDGLAFSVERKSARFTKRKSLQVPPVEKNRKNDDFISITTPSGYILIEPMKDHLKLCTPKGYRTLTGLF